MVARRLGTPAFRPAPRPAAPRDRASPTAKKRGDGLERRSPTGIARERETCTNDAGPSQRESRTTSCRRGERTDPIMWVPAAQPPALHTRTAFQHRRETRAAKGSKSWSAGLRPASRGSAKPAPMTPAANGVQTACTAGDPNGRNRSCGSRPHSPPPFTPAPRSNTVAKRVLPRAAIACSGLRPASIRSAKPRTLGQTHAPASSVSGNRRMLGSGRPITPACLGQPAAEIDACLGPPVRDRRMLP